MTSRNRGDSTYQSMSLGYSQIRKLKRKGVGDEDFYAEMQKAEKAELAEQKQKKVDQNNAIAKALAETVKAPEGKALKRVKKTSEEKEVKKKTKAKDELSTLYARLTDEQRDFVNATLPLEPGYLIKVSACAGSGKTTGLKAFCAKRPTVKFLYLVFNKGMRAEAVKKFRQFPNVTAHTYHSLAFAISITVHGYKLFFPKPKAKFYNQAIQNFMKESGIHDNFANAYKLEERFAFNEQKNPWEYRALWNHAMWAIEKFCSSADDVVLEEHCVKLKELLKKKENIDNIVDARARKRIENAVAPNIKDVVTLARYIIKIIVTKQFMVINQSISIKLLHLLNPDLSAQYSVFALDEAQDAMPVMIKVISRQKMAWLVVGDPKQAINQWLGACNAMSKLGDLVPADKQVTYYFSETFRFGSSVATLTNQLFDRVGYGIKKPVRSNVKPDSKIQIVSDDIREIASTLMADVPNIELPKKGQFKIGIISRTKADILSFLGTWIEELTKKNLDLHYFTVRCSTAVKAEFETIIKYGYLDDRNLMEQVDKCEMEYNLNPNDEEIKSKFKMLQFIVHLDNRQEYVKKVDMLIHPRKAKSVVEGTEGDENVADAEIEDDDTFYAKIKQQNQKRMMLNSDDDDEVDEVDDVKATEVKTAKAPTIKNEGKKIIIELVTGHSSKGLEYDIVVLMPADRDIDILSERASQVVREKNNGGKKEDLRIGYNASLFLLYVMITRVIKTLYIPRSIHDFIVTGVEV